MKTWFITGASRGFGRIWAEAALARGDRVVATARDASVLADLVAAHGDRALALPLDVTDRQATFATMTEAAARMGRLDVVVNNAGYGHFGMLEELSEAEARAQIETNVFGALWVMQAALPLFRAQSGGHLINVSSIGGIRAFPGLSIYCASKWAVEALSDSLSQELTGQNIRMTLVEPGAYATDWSAASARHSTPLPQYEEARAARADTRKRNQAGDPARTATAILALADMADPPLRFLMGANALATVQQAQEARQAEWQHHAALTTTT